MPYRIKSDKASMQCSSALPKRRLSDDHCYGIAPILSERLLKSQKTYRYHVHHTVSCYTQNEKSQAPKMQLKVQNNVAGRPQGDKLRYRKEDAVVVVVCG
jgi:hypothetical protein